MIISCEKCNKKFEVPENAIPETGRILQCGTCSHKWHYIKKNLILPEEEKNLEKDITKNNDRVDSTSQNIENKLKEDKSIKKEKKKLGFFNYLLVLIISFVALIILIDTFKFQISYILPNIDFFLNSLYETFKDIYLFIKDLF